jgi:Spy/CpxP family protein refolding chaperone
MAMKTKMSKVLAVTIVAAMVLTISSAYAGEGWKGAEGKGDREAYFKKMTAELQLTPQQKTELDKQREEFGAKTKDVRERINSARKALREELDKPTPDMAQINSLVGQIKDLTGQQLQAKVDKVLAMKKVLTAEQINKMKTLREERGGRKGPGRGDKGGKDSPHGVI